MGQHECNLVVVSDTAGLKKIPIFPAAWQYSEP